MTWYVPRRGAAVATDTSEAYGVSVVARLGELCEATSTGGELVVVASRAGVSVVARVAELCDVTSTGGGLVVVARPVGVSVVARLGELREATSASGELVVIALAVVGVGDVATGRAFG
jgi:hypothetical protein